MYDKFVESRPLSDSLAPPRCDFESYFSISEPQSSVCPRLRIYPHVNELVAQSSEQATKLARESKLLSKVIPLRRKVFPVADQPDYASPHFLNPDFTRISATFADFEKVERVACTLVAGQSQSYWLLSALLSQLKQDGFRPSDHALSDKNISSLSASFASQTSVCAGLSDFIMAKCREFLGSHVFSGFGATEDGEGTFSFSWL